MKKKSKNRLGRRMSSRRTKEEVFERMSTHVPFGGTQMDYAEYLNGLHSTIMDLTDEIEELRGHKEEVDRLLKADKDNVVKALEANEERVMVGRSEVDIDIAVERYLLEIEEVLTRVENQKLVGSKGNIILVRNALCDFVNMVRSMNKEYRAYILSKAELNADLERLDHEKNVYKQQRDNAREQLEELQGRFEYEREENNRLHVRISDLIREIEELKKPRLPTSLNQKRTIQRDDK